MQTNDILNPANLVRLRLVYIINCVISNIAQGSGLRGQTNSVSFPLSKYTRTMSGLFSEGRLARLKFIDRRLSDLSVDFDDEDSSVS